MGGQDRSGVRRPHPQDHPNGFSTDHDKVAMTIEKLIQFVSNNFEILVWFNATWVACLVIIWVLVKIQVVSNYKPRTLIPGVMLFLVTVGQIAMIFLSGYIYWLNYQHRSAETFGQRLTPTTNWVKEDLVIYFISDKSLLSINANGANKREIFQAPDKIREYHFSPDGRFLVIVTERELHLFHRDSRQSVLIDSIPASDPALQLNGVIGRVSWSPDSGKFCYEVAKWSKVSSHTQFNIYDLKSKEKHPLHKLAQKIPSLYWDMAGANLYFFKSESMDTSRYPYPHKIKICKIPLATFEVEIVAEILTKEMDIARLDVEARGIKLFWEGAKFSFNRSGPRDYDWVSDTGSRLGIHADDFLYYIKNRW